MKFNVTHMDRRFFLGGAAVVAGTAVAGGLPLGAKALLQPAAAAPVVSVFMDMPFVDTSGQHAAYRPPLAFVHDHFEPHFHI